MIFKHVLFLTLALSTSAASNPKKFLRRAENDVDEADGMIQRRIKKSKGIIDADPNDFVPPTPAPVKLSTDLNDWILGCPKEAASIEVCVFPTSSVTTPRNCMGCLKGFSSLDGANSQGASSSCSRSVTCGTRCSKEALAPFFDCGLQVDADFYGIVLDPNDSTLPPVQPPPPTNPPTVGEPEMVWDTLNCPALWPFSGTTCVMLEGFDYKYCVYYEYSADSICTCRKDELLWVCQNGPEAIAAAEAEAAVEPPTTSSTLVIEKNDLTVTVEEPSF